MAAVIDLFSRQVVGWSMQAHMQSGLVTDALKMVWFRRQPAPGAIFQSDRCSQSCGQKFQDTLKGYEMKSSMRRKGNCWATASTESLWGYGSPMQFEKSWEAAQRLKAAELEQLSDTSNRGRFSTMDCMGNGARNPIFAQGCVKSAADRAVVE